MYKQIVQKNTGLINQTATCVGPTNAFSHKKKTESHREKNCVKIPDNNWIRINDWRKYADHESH